MASEQEGADAGDSRSVPLTDIDGGDERFRITTRRTSDDLQTSIRRFGLRMPPLLASAGAGFIIVSGFRRVDACRAMEWDSVPVRILQTASAYECALRAVAENSMERPLNLIETSRALNLLEQTTPGGRVHDADAAALGLPIHPGLTARLKRLCRMPVEVQDGILEGALSFAMACELGRLEEHLATAFACLFRRLKPSLSKQREILSLVVEIAGRENVDPRQVLAECGLTQAMDASDPDRNQQIHGIRRQLRRRRFPALAAAEHNFFALRQRLRLGAALQLTPPRDFEGTGFTLTLSFQTIEEVARLRSKLDELIDHPDFKILLTGKGRGFERAPDS